MLTDHPSIAGWLHHAALRISRGMQRQAARRQIREARAAAAAPRAQDAGEPGSAQDDELDAAISALPERYRVPVVLHYLEGLSLAEMSRRLAISEAALAQQLSRARRKLQRRARPRSRGGAGRGHGAGACPAEARARALDLAHHPQAAPAHLAHAAGFAAATHALPLALAGIALAMAVAVGAAVLAMRPPPTPAAPVAHASNAAHAAVAAAPPGPQSPAPGTAAWATDAAWDTMSRNEYPLGTMWLAEGVRDAASDDRPPTGTWARIGSVADAPHDGDWAPARDRMDGWTVGVPRVGAGAALWGPADGVGLSGARPGKHCFVFISEAGCGDAVLAPMYVSGGGAEWVVAVDQWQDLKGRQILPLRRHVLLVDLGSLPPGRITVRLLERHFVSAAGPNDYYWADTKFANADVEVGAASAPTIIQVKDLGHAIGMGMVRSGRTPRIERSALIPWSPGDGGVAEPLARWTGFMNLGDALALLARPRLPASLPVVPLAGIAQPALVIVGPALPSGGHLWLYDHMSFADGPSIRAQWWLTLDQPGPDTRCVIVVPVPAHAAGKPARDMHADWTISARGTAYANTSLVSYGGVAGDGWLMPMLTAEVKQVIKQQLQVRPGQPRPAAQREF